MDPARRAFYQFHATLMEPWDGPACVAFTDGIQVGAVLDRNGLRPGRYWVTDDGLVVLATEAGVLDIDPAKVVRKGRLQPGRMFLVDTAEQPHHRGRRDQGGARRRAPLRGVAARRADRPGRPARARAHRAHRTPRSPAASRPSATPRRSCGSCSRRWPAAGAEPIGSMGTDTPIAVLSERPRLLFDYFTQLFAQVTNPPLDAIREELVTSLHSLARAGGQPARARRAASCRSVTALPGHRQRRAGQAHPHQRRRRPAGLQGRHALRALPRRRRRRRPARPGSSEICAEVDAAIEAGARIIVLSDRHSDAELAPIPSLLLTAAVHHHLIREAAHPGRPGGRGRRRARGAPRRAAHRLRRRRRQPVPGLRVGRGPDAGRRLPARATTPPRRPSAT